MLTDAIKAIVQGRDLTREEAAAALEDIMTGHATHTQIGAFLAALHTKGETIDEITGLASTMRAKATRVPTTRRPLVDTCGTGGDHSGTFNISTTAAFVVAGAGVAVAKHGNRSATSKCGSADVLESLGVKIDASPEHVGKCIDEVGIGFLFARSLHSSMKHVAASRSELAGIPTVFNILGPLTNPAGACGQVMGCFNPELLEPLARVLLNLGSRHAFLVAGSDGLDELTLAGPSTVVEGKAGKIETYEVSPDRFGLSVANKEMLAGGEAAANAEILRGVLNGERGPKRDVVLMNAAPAIIAGEKAETWEEALAAAQHSIDSGAAREKLERLIGYTNCVD